MTHASVAAARAGAASCAILLTAAPAWSGAGACALLLAAGPAGVRAGFAVPLEVRESAGVAREGWPVTSGLPLERGRVRSVEELRLRAGGSAVPAQFRALSRWPDGSLKWALCDFQASVPARGKARFVLEGGAGAAGRPEVALRVRDRAGRIEVDTGAIRFSIAKGRFTLFDRVSVGGSAILSATGARGVVVTAVDGRVFSTERARPDAVRIEERGPLRAAIRVDGRLPFPTGSPGSSPLKYTTWYHAYAGKPFVRVVFILKNEDEGTVFARGKEHAFEDLRLRLRLRLRERGSLRAALGGEETFRAALRARDRVSLYQDSSGGAHWGPAPGWDVSFRGFRIHQGDRVATRGMRAAGWGDLSGARAGIGIAVRHFWQNFPKAIAFSGEGEADVVLFPGRWKVPHRFEGARYKQHEILFAFHRVPARVPVEQTARAFFAPLRAVAPPAWYRDTGACGRIATAGSGLFPRYDGTARNDLDALLATRERDDAYGWLHFGDFYRDGDKGRRAWGNNEFDLGWCLLIQYLRFSDHDPRFFDLGESILRHLMDIDIYHSDKGRRDFHHIVRRHDVWPKSGGSIARGDSTDHRGQPMPSHMWVQGLLLYHLLTGDPGARACAEEIAEGIRNWWSMGRLRGGPIRWRGWSICALVELYEATGEREHLDLAGRIIAEGVVRRLAAEGYIRGEFGDCVYPWQIGYVTEGIGRYGLARRALGEPDPEAEKALERLLSFLREKAWMPDARRMAYRWYFDGRRQKGYDMSYTNANGFAYAFLLTGKEEHLTWARETARSAVFGSPRRNGWAKAVGIDLRFAQAAMHVLEREAARGPRKP